MWSVLWSSNCILALYGKPLVRPNYIPKEGFGNPVRRFFGELMGCPGSYWKGGLGGGSCALKPEAFKPYPRGLKHPIETYLGLGSYYFGQIITIRLGPGLVLKPQGPNVPM